MRLSLWCILTLALGQMSVAADRWAAKRVECLPKLRPLMHLALLKADPSVLLGDHPAVVRALEGVLDQEDPTWELTANEREAFRHWHKIKGAKQLEVRNLATPFWVRNALSFVTSAPWPGEVKAVVFRFLAERIRERLLDPNTGQPTWTADAYVTETEQVIFHGLNHRCIFSLPRGSVKSERISESELRAMQPYIRGGKLEDYYRRWPIVPVSSPPTLRDDGITEFGKPPGQAPPNRPVRPGAVPEIVFIISDDAAGKVPEVMRRILFDFFFPRESLPSPTDNDSK